MSFKEKGQNHVEGVVLQELSKARAVQLMQGDRDVELASGPLRVLLVTVDVDDPFQEDPFQDSRTAEKSRAVDTPSSDIWLVLEIGSGFSLPVKANQIIKPQRETSSYIIPSADVPGASIQLFISGSHSDEIDQFEDLLADYCAFQLDNKGKGTFELIDEKGHMLGTIDGPWTLQEDSKMYRPGYEKDPVMVELPEEGSKEYGSSTPITVSTAPRDENGAIPASYQNDWLLKGASFVSKTMIGGSTWAGKKMVDAADSYVRKSSPLPGSQDVSRTGSPGPGANMTTSGRPAMTFSPQIYATSGQLKAVSGTVTDISGRTRDAVLGVASKVGDQIGKKTGIQRKMTPQGTYVEPKGLRGVFNRGLIAANMVLDGVTQSAETLIRDGGKASGSIIEHRYGSEAKVISGNTASLGRSAFVVYKDINGVRRKALLKIATGTIRARAPDGSEVVLQQEGNHMTPAAPSQSQSTPPLTSGQASPLPPSYEKGSQLEKRNETPTALSAEHEEQITPVLAQEERGISSTSIASYLADDLVSDSSTAFESSVFLPTTPTSSTSWARRHFHSDWPPPSTMSSEWGRSPFYVHPDSPFVAPFVVAEGLSLSKAELELESATASAPESASASASAQEEGTLCTAAEVNFTGKAESDREGKGKSRRREGGGEEEGAATVLTRSGSPFGSVRVELEEASKGKGNGGTGAHQIEDVLKQPSSKLLFSQYTHTPSSSPHKAHDTYTYDDTLFFCSPLQLQTDNSIAAGLALMGDGGGGGGGGGGMDEGLDYGLEYEGGSHHGEAEAVYLLSSLEGYERIHHHSSLVSSTRILSSTTQHSQCTPRSIHLHSATATASFQQNNSIVSASSDRCNTGSALLHPAAGSSAVMGIGLEGSDSEGRLLSRRLIPRTLPTLASPPTLATVTPHRIWNSQPYEMRAVLGSENAMVKKEEEHHDEEELYSQASEESPLLRASQGSTSSLPCYIARLEELGGRVGDSTVLALPSIKSVKRGREDEDEDEDEESLAPLCCLSQGAKRQRRHRKPRHQQPSSSSCPLSSDAQDEDAASVLLSLAHAMGDPAPLTPPPSQSPSSQLSSTPSRIAAWKALPAAVEAMSTSAGANRTTSPTTPTSSSAPLPPPSALRLLPKNMPIKADLFPRIYHRFLLPRFLGTSKTAAGGSAEIPEEEEEGKRRVAGIVASGGTYNESSTPFDLYTPRWVRGVGRDKEGLCPICFHEGPGQMQGQKNDEGEEAGLRDDDNDDDDENINEGEMAGSDDAHIKWKRIKTSEYNYHLINQHGISPHTLLPFDPPTAYRERHTTAAAKGQRSSFVQGKCHACKKFIDMQGKYVGPVKVPEIYWWKHARRCHKGKKGCSGNGNGENGVFIEDEYYQRVKAAASAR